MCKEISYDLRLHVKTIDDGMYFFTIYFFLLFIALLL